MFGEKKTFGGANPQTELFWWDGSFWILDGSSMFQSVMFWVAWDSVNSTGVWRTHNSCVHLENLPRKSEKLKRHKFPTKRRKFPTKRRNLFGLFSMHICTLTCLPMFSRVCEYQKSAKNARIAADPARIPPNSWNGSFWLRTAEISEATIISLAWAGRRNFTQPPGLGMEVS